MNELQLASSDKPHLWKKGVSGNPSGRPKSDATIKELAKEHTQDALRTLIEIANNKKSPPSARVHAACAILDRAWGKPAQYIETSNQGRSYIEFLESIPMPPPEVTAKIIHELKGEVRAREATVVDVTPTVDILEDV